MPTATIKLSQIALAPSNPASTDTVIGVGGGTTDYQYTVAQIQAGASAPPPVNTVSAGGTITVGPASYGDIVVTTNSAVTINLPTAASRNGYPVAVIGTGTTPNITINAAGGETLLGFASLTITHSYGSYSLWPLTAVGWYQK